MTSKEESTIAMMVGINSPANGCFPARLNWASPQRVAAPLPTSGKQVLLPFSAEMNSTAILQVTNRFGLLSKPILDTIARLCPRAVLTFQGHCRNVGTDLPGQTHRSCLQFSRFALFGLWRAKCLYKDAFNG